MTSVIKPPGLRPGDTIGIAAPASAFQKEAFFQGIERIREAGYETFFRSDIFAREGYLAGSDRRRAAELHALFNDSRIRAVFCARGGYGSQRLLPLLDPGVFRNNPTIFMGYSDITALHSFFNTQCGLVTFHGPLVTELGGMSEEAVSCVLRSLITAPAPFPLPAGRLEVMRTGCADGFLAGGSLSVFTSTLGTPYHPNTDGAILFFEDRGEKPYAVDRLFSHLKLAGTFKAARGLILGQFIPPPQWRGTREAYESELTRIVLDLLREYRFPILSNFPAGHFNESICFPLGVDAAIDGERGTVTLNEPYLNK